MLRDFSYLLGFCRVCPENFPHVPAKGLKILPIPEDLELVWLLCVVRLPQHLDLSSGTVTIL